MESNFANNLKKIRSDRGMTQSELGEKIGVHANHISRYERGDSSPSTETLKAFAQALNVTIDELVFGDKEKQVKNSINDIELLGLIKKLESLSEQEKETIKDLISAFLFRNETRKKLAV